MLYGKSIDDLFNKVPDKIVVQAVKHNTNVLFMVKVIDLFIQNEKKATISKVLYGSIDRD